jgi:hypothetical protein
MKELYFVIEDQNGILYNCDKNLNRISKIGEYLSFLLGRLIGLIVFIGIIILIIWLL